MLRCSRFVLAKPLLPQRFKSTAASVQSNEFDKSSREAVGAAAKIKKYREPLVKNFFAGLVDKQMLAYPEAISRQDYKDVKNELTSFENLYNTELKTNNIKHVEIYTRLQDMKVFNLNVPADFGGRDWNFSASLLATEAEYNQVPLALQLLSHRVVIDVLNEFGSITQQQQYLPQLAQGTLIAADAAFDFDTTVDGELDTKAQYEVETKSWVLNGEKCFIQVVDYLPRPQLLLVLAQTDRLQIHTSMNSGVTAFLVPTDAAGVVFREEKASFSSSNAPLLSVKFDKVTLTEAHVLGKEHDAVPVAQLLLRSRRLRGALIATGVAKNALSAMTLNLIGKHDLDTEMIENESIKVHLANVERNIYGMESLIYYTAGLLDELSNQDLVLETSIIRNLSITKLVEIIQTLLQILGPRAFIDSHPLNYIIKDLALLFGDTESTDLLQIFIGLSGLQHVGGYAAEDITKTRNPLYNPLHIFKHFIGSSNIETPKTNLNLGDHLHPSLAPAAQCLELSIARLKIVSEILLTRHGNIVVNKHAEVKRLAQAATLIYEAFASISRASRSYCIGLQFADNELLMASTIAMIVNDRVKKLCEEIFTGEYTNGDRNFRRLSKKLLTQKGYFFENPLTYNF